MNLTKPPAEPDPGQTAAYIEHMAKELSRMAEGAGLGFLAFLLRMVEDDAGRTAKKSVEDAST